MTNTPRKLILFDIDGTLIRHSGPPAPLDRGWARFIHAGKKVYGVSIKPDSGKNYHGFVDRQIFYDMVRPLGISKAEFDRKFPQAAEAIYGYALDQEKKRLYEAIPQAVELLHRVRARQDLFYSGILTGNIEKMAYWKLRHVGIEPEWFSLFITGDDFDDRISLARSAFARVEKEAGLVVTGKDTYVIGDAVGDILCARAIGASSIIATTGRHIREELEAENPTLLVDHLMDRRVLEMLGLDVAQTTLSRINHE